MTTRTVPITDFQNSKTAGSKHEGWVVRVIDSGKVVRIASSMPQLQAFAEKEAALLDSLASEAKIQPPQKVP